MGRHEDQIERIQGDSAWWCTSKIEPCLIISVTAVHRLKRFFKYNDICVVHHLGGCSILHTQEYPCNDKIALWSDELYQLSKLAENKRIYATL